MFTGHPIELSSANFTAHTQNSDIPVVVDFWAPWCGPCKVMAPSFDRAAAELEPDVRLGKLNTEDQPGIASQFGVRSIPTLAIFRNGRELARQAGALDYGNLVRWVRTHS